MLHVWRRDDGIANIRPDSGSNHGGSDDGTNRFTHDAGTINSADIHPDGGSNYDGANGRTNDDAANDGSD